LKTLAYIEDPTRRRDALLLLPKDWAPVRALQTLRDDRKVEKIRKAIKLSEQQEFDSAQHFVAKLGANEQLFIAITILQSLDPDRISELTDPGRKMTQLFFVVDGLKSLLPEASSTAAAAAESHEQASR
jgi:hypothetical protein